MRLVTVATQSEAYFPYLLKSCARFRAQLDVLGWGQKWRGFTWRSHLLVDYLNKLDDDEIVCVIDAYDVLLLRPLDELEQAFREFHARTRYEIVAGCETASSFTHGLHMKWLFGTCRNKYVNAGTYVGFARALRDLVAGVLRLSEGDMAADDQQLLTLYCSGTPGGANMYMDCPNDFFLTLSGNSDTPTSLQVKDGQLTFGNKRPFLIHANAQVNINDIVCQLGYRMSDREQYRLKKYILDTNHKKFFDYLPRYYACFLMVACCCVFAVLKLRGW